MIRSLLIAASLGALCVPAARAHSEYQAGFFKLYTKGPEVDNDFRKLARKAKCNLCHQGKEDRKNYNRYGEVLTEYLHEGDKKDRQKIADALTEVAGLPSDGPDSPTFGEMITAGELPGGPLEESKKEPAESDAGSDD